MNFHVLDSLNQGIGAALYSTFWGPIAFQLWFVRDMLIFVWLLPILYLLLRPLSRSRWASILAIALLFAVLSYWGVSVLWMAIGGIMAMGNVMDVPRRRDNRGLAWGSTMLFTCLVLANALGWESMLCSTLIRPVGIVFAWTMYDVVSRGRLCCQSPKGRMLTGYTFFIYLSHIPLLLIFKKIPLLVSRSEPMIIICYLLVPLVYVAFAIIVGSFLKKKIPSLYYLYTGGR